MLAEQASSLLWAGRIADAEAICRLLLGRELAPSLEGTVRIYLGHVLLSGGRAREGLRELKQPCQSPVLTGAERAGARAWASITRLWLEDLDGAAAAAEEARSAAVSARDHFIASVAVASLAVVSQLRGDLRDALQIIDDAVQLADESPGKLGHPYPLHIPRGFILVTLDRLGDARSTLEAGRRISEDVGIPWPVAHDQAVRALERFIAGHWDDAIAEIETAGLASETAQTYTLILAHSMLSLIRLHLNDLPGAREAAATAAGELDAAGRRVPHQLVCVGPGPCTGGRWRAHPSARDPRQLLGPVRKLRGSRWNTPSSGPIWSGSPRPLVIRAGPGMSRPPSPAWRLVTRCPGSPVPHCAARD